MKIDFTAKPIIVNYKCPYCGRESADRGAIEGCHGMCHLTTLIDTHFIKRSDDDTWHPPLQLKHFATWSTGDRHEFARRLEAFFKEFYQ